MTDIGVSCQKNSYVESPSALVCTSSQVEDAALCYEECSSGYDGVGPVCWDTCPSGMYDCGALCTEDADGCTEDVLDMVKSVLELAGSVAESAVGDIDIEGLVEDSGDVADAYAFGICNPVSL